jgi:hypothetical protein
MAQLDFPNSPTVGATYSAPNGAVYTWDGAAWTVSGVLSTGTAAGGDLTGTYPNPSVGQVASGTLTIGAAGAPRITLANDPSGLSYFATNYSFAPEDTTKASWTMRLRSAANAVEFLNRAPGAAAGGGTVMMTLDGSGNVRVPGTAGNASLVAGSRTVKVRVQAAATQDAGYFLTNAVLNAAENAWVQDDNTKPSWIVSASPGSPDQFSIGHLAAGGAYTSPLVLDASGNLTISGATATKASGTTWANPSDRRIKKNIAPYAQGLAAILALEPKTFEFNGLGGSQDGLGGIGLIAQDVEPVMPEMVAVTPTKLRADDAAPVDLLTLDTTALSLALVNAVKELTARVAALEAQLAAQEQGLNP